MELRINRVRINRTQPVYANALNQEKINITFNFYERLSLILCAPEYVQTSKNTTLEESIVFTRNIIFSLRVV